MSESRRMDPADVPEQAKAALQAIVDSGQAKWYLSGGAEKIEFTAISFCAWYMTEHAEIERQVREKVSEEIELLQGELIVARSRVKALEANDAELLARAERAESATERVRALADQAQQKAEQSFSRMLGGGPFPAGVSVVALLAVLDAPGGGS